MIKIIHIHIYPYGYYYDIDYWFTELTVYHRHDQQSESDKNRTFVQGNEVGFG